jgi:hypothetical protein
MRELSGKSFEGKVDLLGVAVEPGDSGNWRISLLLRANEKLDFEYKIGLSARVDKSHASYLSEEADKEHLQENLTFWPTPPSTEWPVAEEVLITTEVPLKPIPYHFYVGLYANDPPHRLGIQTSVGWIVPAVY